MPKMSIGCQIRTTASTLSTASTSSPQDATGYGDWHVALQRYAHPRRRSWSGCRARNGIADGRDLWLGQRWGRKLQELMWKNAFMEYPHLAGGGALHWLSLFAVGRTRTSTRPRRSHHQGGNRLTEFWDVTSRCEFSRTHRLLALVDRRSRWAKSGSLGRAGRRQDCSWWCRARSCRSPQSV
jgi:hypothetical protein